MAGTATARQEALRFLTRAEASLAALRTAVMQATLGDVGFAGRGGPTVALFPSQLGAVLGLDPYLPRDVVLGQTWMRTNSTNYRAAAAAWTARDRQPLTRPRDNDGGGSSGGAGGAGGASWTTPTDPAPDVLSADAMRAWCRNKSKKEVGVMYCAKGHVGEQATVELLEREGGLTLTQRNGAVWWHRDGSGGFRDDAGGSPAGPVSDDPPPPGDYALSGQVDAAITDAATGALVPVEIKTRMRRLAGAVRDREWLQIQAYIQALKAPYGLLVERVQGDDAVVRTRIERDDARWAAEVVPAMDTFVQEVRRLLRGGLGSDDALRHQVLTAVAGYTGTSAGVAFPAMTLKYGPVVADAPAPSPPAPPASVLVVSDLRATVVARQFGAVGAGLARGDLVGLVREPGNPLDSSAVRVVFVGRPAAQAEGVASENAPPAPGALVGYLSRTFSTVAAAFLDKVAATPGSQVNATVVGAVPLDVTKPARVAIAVRGDPALVAAAGKMMTAFADAAVAAALRRAVEPPSGTVALAPAVGAVEEAAVPEGPPALRPPRCKRLDPVLKDLAKVRACQHRCLQLLQGPRTRSGWRLRLRCRK
jgi:hypothetical protein